MYNPSSYSSPYSDYAARIAAYFRSLFPSRFADAPVAAPVIPAPPAIPEVAAPVAPAIPQVSAPVIVAPTSPQTDTGANSNTNTGYVFGNLGTTYSGGDQGQDSGAGSNINTGYVTGNVGNTYESNSSEGDVTANYGGSDWTSNYRNGRTQSGGMGRDVVTGGAGSDTLDGGMGNDRLVGGAGDDRLFGGMGDDYLNGGDGNDLLDGGMGNDQLYGGAGDDRIDAGMGNDVVYAGKGNDSVNGGMGDDVIYGEAGNDRLYGGMGNDRLVGGAGDDVLEGGMGNDRLEGGAGNDTYVFEKNFGRDVLVNGDASSATTDKVVFTEGSKATAERLWFSREGNDLVIDVLDSGSKNISYVNGKRSETPIPGSEDRLTVSNWFGSADARVDMFRDSDGHTLDKGKVDGLVSAMAAFGKPAGSSSLSTEQRQQLDTVIAANWS
ncbi:MAG TPA: calcium-binding protein [Stenotrophomonas sp.]|nr:calcium-binding protein [Stenotrophomonas sp.]